MKTLIILVVILNFSFIACKSACNDLKSCGDCISYVKERCLWCAQDQEIPVRCQSQSEVNDKWCQPDAIINPNSTEQVQENKKFSSVTGKEVQLRPQKMTVTLRPGVPVSFNMSYLPAKDYPLDLYFLMDNSFTMKTKAEALAKEAKNIYETLKNMTKNVLIGLGTFVEKPELPYSDPRKQNTYAFKHHLSLTDDMDLFKQEVDSYPKNIGSNYDSPEAGLDALMQVMTCTDEIGWRKKSSKGPQSRRIILVATDGTYHSVGDGKMVGAYIPNNMTCLLDENHMYDKRASLTMDYPSVSQINYVAQQNDMMIVFSVHGKVFNIYDTLKDGMQKAHAVELKADEIVKVVADSYKKASRQVLIERRNVPAMINVTTFCGDCISTQENPEVLITATVTALKCPTNKNDQTFDLEVSGLPDKLTVEVKIDCECPCEKIKPAIKSADCDNAGLKLCGVCKCDTNRSGDTCKIQCSGKDDLANMALCREADDANTYCNGQGSCLCGLCKCNSDFSGKYCQYNDAECRKHCPQDRGSCRLGNCTCNDDSQWTGPQCDCPVSNDTCISPFTKQHNGAEYLKHCPQDRGSCRLGNCTCNDDSQWTGPQCECPISNDTCINPFTKQHNGAEYLKHCPQDRGSCRLGNCTCNDDSQWTGPQCDCPVSNDTRISPFTKQPCSGKGICTCGKCKCDSKDSANYGLLAYCTDPAKDLCEQLKDYAICSYEKKTKTHCDKSYTKTSVDKVTIMNKTKLDEETTATACRKTLDDGNILVYKFIITTDPVTNMAKLELMIQKELESPPVVNLWITVGSVVGGVLFVGLLTLIIWKVVTGIYDKREYDRFCKEATDQGFDVANPVYLDPTVSFVNPAFKGQRN